MFELSSHQLWIILGKNSGCIEYGFSDEYISTLDSKDSYIEPKITSWFYLAMGRFTEFKSKQPDLWESVMFTNVLLCHLRSNRQYKSFLYSPKGSDQVCENYFILDAQQAQYNNCTYQGIKLAQSSSMARCQNQCSLVEQNKPFLQNMYHVHSARPNIAVFLWSPHFRVGFPSWRRTLILYVLYVEVSLLTCKPYQNVPITEDGVATSEFIDATEGVVKLFDLLGSSAFAVVQNDMNGNIKVRVI